MVVVYGKEGGVIKKQSRLMWPVPCSSLPPSSRTVAPNVSSTTSLVKDGRKISVGDCALFKPAQDSPPFVGIIRSLIPDKESSLTFGVNWLYRRAEVKLLKGVPLDAAPNEVFYSFHRDEIPAASLLHPCKVAFLSRGAELPAGVSSFVCRRVYDITNKCLWWLTDQDFIDERQEEVNKLLNRTRIEMIASVDQLGPRSPKLSNCSTAASLQKDSPDSVQTSSSNLPFQTKGKKRDRQDQASVQVKREPNACVDGANSGQLRSDGLMNSEIVRIAEKGGLADSKAVARLLRLMQTHNPEKKLDLTRRSMLAGVVAVTDKLDCLSQFVQLKGVAVFDGWLQEVHKGTIGDFGINSDELVEDFLLVLLRALDKLPVNLNALQMCNIGKSVNHLRSHKNAEIQKKARSLVDTWKKRVEAEMNINDTESAPAQAVQWPGRSRDSSHSTRHSNGSSGAAVRSSVTHHSSLKSSTVKIAQGELPVLTSNNCKDRQSRSSVNGGISEPPQTVVRVEKNGGLSQSRNNSQCLTDHAKFMVSCAKEDVKRSITSSKSLNKSTNGGSKHRKSSNGYTSAVHKETVPIISPSTARSSLVEKVSPNDFESSVNVGNIHKLIVKIPKRIRGPAQSIVAASAEDTSGINSGASSPERLDQSDGCQRGKDVSHQSKDVGGSLAAEHQRPSDIGRNVSKAAHPPRFSEMKFSNVHNSSFGPLNALIEICMKLSVAHMSMSAGDGDGMNLLASVAAGEFLKSDISSPAVSPSRPSTTGENSGYNGNIKELHGDDMIEQEGLSADGGSFDECNKSSGVSNVNNGDSSEYLDSAKVEGCTGDEVSDQHVIIACSTQRSGVDVLKINGGVINHECDNRHLAVRESVGSPVDAEEKVNDSSLNVESEKSVHRDTTYPSITVGVVKSNVFVEPENDGPLEPKSCAVSLQCEPTHADKMPAISSKICQQSVTNTDDMAEISSRTCQQSVPVNGTLKLEKTVAVEFCDHEYEHDKGRLVQENAPSRKCENQKDLEMHHSDVAMDTDCKDEYFDNKEALVQQSRSSGVQVCSSTVHLTENGDSSTKENNLVTIHGEKKVDSADGTVIAADTKLEFDLNEGLNVDEGRHPEPGGVAKGPFLANICSASPLQKPVSSAPGGPITSITVAAAAKGPFVPPDGLLRDKKEPGWKGSAATSAFRPAEPRKIELPLSPTEAPHSDGAACKQARPPLDIDLNVADEDSEPNIKDDSFCRLITTPALHISGGLDLDLNKIDEASDMEASGKRDFDLNFRPAVEEIPVEQIPYCQPLCSNIPLQSDSASRINYSDASNVFPWNPSGTSYSVNLSPSVLPDREVFPVGCIGNGTRRVMGGPSSNLSFNADAYRGSVLGSSSVITFQSAPLQYPVFPFGTSFPLPTSGLAGGPSGYMDLSASGRVSAIPSQLARNAAAVSFQYPHAYVVSRPIPDVSSNVVTASNKKWGSHGLDLNSGPGGVDLEGRDGSMPAVSRDVSAISSQLSAEEQTRMFIMGGGILKRKEPDGGWSMDKLNFKQPSWWK